MKKNTIIALLLLIVAYVAFCLYMLVEHPVAAIIAISVAVFALYQLVIRSKVDVDNEYPELVEKFEKLERRRRMREILKPMGRKSTAYPDGKVDKYAGGEG